MTIAKKITVILSDDVRSEVGNKISIMGIYGNDIMFDAKLPLILPKFSVCVILQEIKVVPEVIGFKLYMPKSEPIDITLPPPEKIEIGKDAHIVVQISPLKINAFGRARVVISLGDLKPVITHKFNLVSKEDTESKPEIRRIRL